MTTALSKAYGQKDLPQDEIMSSMPIHSESNNVKGNAGDENQKQGHEPPPNGNCLALTYTMIPLSYSTRKVNALNVQRKETSWQQN
ncbi:hypothetical protein BTVI_34044 [Pitangus sulphuratus]|nr:hypothetical protein BTVI_34044 [Pitangus sulphuratus]